MAVRILKGDCREVLRTLPDESVQCCVTSPPYFGLRDYGTRRWVGGREDCQHEGDGRYYTEKTASTSSAGAFSGPGEANKERLKAGRWREGGKCIHCGAEHHDPQIGLEPTPADFVAEMVKVFSEVRRVLVPDGTLWLNLGDSYSGSGRGGNPEDSPHKKQRTNAGSLTVVGATARHAATTRLAGDDRNFGLKPKDLIGIPWMTAFALRAEGWYLRSEIIWAKPNGMPGSQQDRCTSSHETIFMFSKSRTYWSDFDAIKTPPRESTLVRTAQDIQAQAGSHRANGGGKTNGTMKAVGGLTGSPHGRHSLGDAIPEKERRSDKQSGHSRTHAGFNDRWDAKEKVAQPMPAMMRDVWFVPPGGYDEAHFAVMPDEIARRCIVAGCPAGGTVIDPFGGAGTTALVADRFGRHAISIELNPEYAAMQERRITDAAGLFADVAG